MVPGTQRTPIKRAAVHLFRCARDARRVSRSLKNLGRNTGWVYLDHILIERRCIQSHAAGKCSVVAAHAFIREEEEQLIFDDGTANTASELSKFLVYALRTLSCRDRELARGPGFARYRTELPCGWAIEFVESIQALIIEFNHAAAMKPVSAALGDSFNLGPGVRPSSAE